MQITKPLEFQGQGIIEMLKHQNNAPYYSCDGVYEVLRKYPQTVTRETAISLFMLGYIHGKRAERARKKTA